ncbi:hypothetical protein EYF80_001296 [Liparis tanakae]|uniref:Uncharacterized protein n=1 Tax=Liparis tanakae TaxID=230148 RepID=A0A4Z2JFD5_9TELE|nr:hypothetical protein EYF80_001296 [Liparis tanakae]
MRLSLLVRSSRQLVWRRMRLLAEPIPSWAGRAAILHRSTGRHRRRREVLCAHQFADAVARKGVWESFEGQRTFLRTEVGVGQRRVQREQVGWRGQDLSPLCIRENGSVGLIWQRKKRGKQTITSILMSLPAHRSSPAAPGGVSLSAGFPSPLSLHPAWPAPSAHTLDMRGNTDQYNSFWTTGWTVGQDSLKKES